MAFDYCYWVPLSVAQWNERGARLCGCGPWSLEIGGITVKRHGA